MRSFLIKKIYPVWKTKYSTLLKKRRLDFINKIFEEKLLDQTWLKNKNILEIGCANGKDFIQFFKDCHDVHITGVDITDYEIDQNNVTFLKLDAENLPFEDNHFDLCVSIGVFEHIQPIEKLCNLISEVERVSKSYVIIVPSISTFFEPHAGEFLWQIKPAGKKKIYSRLNYYSDEAWLQFQGFNKANIKRFSYIPFFIKNTIIYKLEY